MTHLMGLTVKDDENPNGDIEIKFSGLRPGEKLYEELLIDDHAQPTAHKRILTANEQSINWADVNRLLERITNAMKDENVSEIRQLLIDAPLGFTPESHSKMAKAEAEAEESTQVS